MEERLNEIEEKVDKLLDKTDTNAKSIGENKEQIIRNTSAFEILRTFKVDSIMFFVMWLLTFIGLVCYIIFKG